MELVVQQELVTLMQPQVQKEQIQLFQQLHRQVVELVMLQELVEVILLEDLEVE